MDAKLITDGNNNYSVLGYNNELVATNMESVFTNQKLSIKNCEAIKNGYDLDELIESSKHDLIHANISESLYYSRGIYYGFQKALELLGDKKFSEDDVISMIKKSREKTPYNFDGKSTEYKFSEDEITQSLQPKEWDVEIVMIHGFDDVNDPKPFSVPKLDKDGCVILKRK